MKKDVYELTNPQKSIWLTEEFYKGTAINNICGNLIIREKVDFEKFIKAVNLFVKTNESFRLKFFIEDSTPKQYVSDFAEFDLEIIDINSEDELLKFQQETASEVFEIIDSLLFKFKIVRLPDGSGGFIINAHHLISDAATFAILATETVKIYSSLINNTEFEYNTNLYTDYIKSEREYLQSEKFKKDEIYWNDLYKEVPEVATIPSLLNKSEKNSNESLREEFIIPKDLFDKINTIFKGNRISSYNLFMAIYAIYLGRVSNLDEFVICTPILNRTNFVEKNTSGMFISTAPFKISLNHELSFADFAKKIATDSLSMLRHQKYPYQFLLENLRKQNGHVPNLYDFMFSYQITKATDKSIDVPYTTHWAGNNQISNSLEVHAHDNDSNGTVTIAYDYTIGKYTKEDITNLHNRILCMLDQIISNPNILLKDIEIVTPEEKHKILYAFNNTKVDFDYMPNIVLEIEKIAFSNGNKIALETDNKSITYKELIERINQLSNMLITKFNIPENSTIGISTNRTIDTIVGILSIAKINCTYVPIDPTYPKDRILNMIADSKIKYVLSDNYKNDINSFENLEILNIDYSKYSKESKVFSKNIEYDKNSNLYIIFTSGSTGKPKGVTISHKNMLNLIYFEKYKTSILSPDSKILQFATMSFDVSYQEIFSALLTGSTLVLIDDLIRKDMLKLANYIIKHSIDTLFIPPAYLRLLTEDISIISKLSKTLKAVITAGEQLIITMGIKELINNGIKIYNHYGPAETHVATTFAVETSDITNPPIGYPISNTKVLILDKNAKLSPIGVLGEIVILGDCVGNGYYNDPELTNQKFLSNEFSKHAYYTGDLGYYDYSGCIHFMGRADFQVKINGFRIELEEIDSIISSITLVDSVKSIIIEKDLKKHIITYYSSNSVTEEYLMKYLNNKLPYYMMPKKIVKLDDMPINANGKIDKNKLPGVDLTLSTSEIKNATTNSELALQKIWYKLFDTNKIGINVNFFEIGGDSLLAIKLCAEIYKKLNIETTVQDVFSNPTIYELAKFLDTKKTSKVDLIIKTTSANFYPTSSAQKRIYYSSKVAGDGTTYNMPGSLILSEMPDMEKLEKSFNSLIEKHETLRTYFEVIGGEVVQKIKEKINFRIELDDEICKDKCSAFTEFVKPFDLSKAPLLRVKLVKLEKKQALLLFDMHHIISDGTSMQILINELCKLYNGEISSPLEITYKDYSVWEQNNLKENKLKQSEKFWVNQFTDELPVLNLPTNRTRPTVQSFEGDNIYKKLDKKLTLKINTLAKELNLTPYMLLLSCYYILLYKYTSNEDIIVGTPVVGRDSSQTTDIIGMFVNSLPLRQKLNSNETFLEFSKAVKEMCLNAFQHQAYPFDELVNKLNIKRDSSRNPLFDTMFIYQNDGNAKVNLGNIKSKYYIPDSNTSKFDLSLEITPEDSKLNLRFEYATKLFNKEFVEYLSTHYINILKIILENNSIKIADIEMLSEKEKQKILYKFNNTKVHYQKNKTIIDLFEEQVKKSPNNIAVVFEDQKLTYKDLNGKANNLATNLINKNINQNNIVGIMLPRSLDLIISIFGILKAGAGYMLIDPNLPNERINYMLKNADAKVLLTYKDFKNIKYNTIYLDNFKLENTKNPNLKLSNENNLAVIYTSGSTGEPKGVKLKQKGLLNLLLAYQTILNTNICTNFLCSSSVSFDMFIVETFIPILSGKTIILANDDERQIPTHTSRLIKKNHVHFILTTPSKMDLLLTSSFSSCLENVKVIQLGGEIFTKSLYDKLSKVTNANIYNGYGPTEITACCSNKKIINSEDINIGKPICNTQILILDKDNNICPIDVPGELCVFGDGVSKGYINNIESTNKSFIKTIYYKELAYKTGDVAKFNKNGELVYIGRNDNQIKIRGLRIELSEIENKLLNIEKIEKCAVIYKKEPKNPHIVAFFIASKTLDISDIRKELAKALPTYMIPKYIIQIAEMPITPNGKINTKELATKEIDVTDTNYVAPKTDKQKLFCKILEDLLNVKIGIADDLFELGLDSLIAIKFKVELLNNSIDIDYANIFKYHTVKELCDEKANEIEVAPLNNYNYDGINKVLSKNIFRNNINIETNTNNNILLLGATGFVGAHILNSFIQKDKGNVYCIVRDKNNTSAKARFLDTLHFYFGTKLDKYIDKRIFVLKGDLLKENFGLSTTNINMLRENISVVINSAANVKHYGNVEKFNSINVGLAHNLIEFCKNNNKRLIHLSSLSISGNMVLDGTSNKNISKNKLDFTEKDLYIGQALDNVYTRSKFEAERLILDNINQGLNALILRLGNITNRCSDGVFQINPEENAFLTRVSSLINIGSIPETILKDYIEFTPVDLCADAIVTIMQNHVKNHSVMHIYDYNHVYIDDLLENLKKSNININILSGEEFSDLLSKLLKDSSKKKHISGIINDLSSDKKLSYEGNVNVKSNFSIQFLEKIGFIWPKIDEKYIIKYVKYLRKNELI